MFRKISKAIVQNVIKILVAIVLCMAAYFVGFHLIPSYQSASSDAEVSEPILQTENKLVALKTEAPNPVEEENAIPKMLFGFATDSFKVVQEKIRKNEFLGEILTRHHVDYVQIDKLARKSKDTADVRSINYNKPYTIFLKEGDSLDVAQYFVYEPNVYKYVIYDLTDETNVEVVERKITKELRQASGVIQSSLYETMLDNHLSPVLANALSEVYAWSVDFYRIQKGDRFKVIFEEEYIDCEPVGVGEIKAAWFEHRGTDFYGFMFEQDHMWDYYDLEGKSLRKQFLKAPLKYSRISSRFSRRRFHPVTKRYKAHLGTDYAAPKGTPIRAVGDGSITEARYKKYNGNYVKIRHNGTYTTQYLHLSKFGKGIKPGKMVRQGDIIGYVGQTGLATGPHLCFRFWKNGKQVDPFKQKLPPSKPVKEGLMDDYQLVVDAWKPELDAIPFQNLPVETDVSADDDASSDETIQMPIPSEDESAENQLKVSGGQ